MSSTGKKSAVKKSKKKSKSSSKKQENVKNSSELKLIPIEKVIPTTPSLPTDRPNILLRKFSLDELYKLIEIQTKTIDVFAGTTKDDLENSISNFESLYIYTQKQLVNHCKEIMLSSKASSSLQKRKIQKYLENHEAQVEETKQKHDISYYSKMVEQKAIIKDLEEILNSPDDFSTAKDIQKYEKNIIRLRKQLNESQSQENQLFLQIKKLENQLWLRQTEKYRLKVRETEEDMVFQEELESLDESYRIAKLNKQTMKSQEIQRQKTISKKYLHTLDALKSQIQLGMNILQYSKYISRYDDNSSEIQIPSDFKQQMVQEITQSNVTRSQATLGPQLKSAPEMGEFFLNSDSNTVKFWLKNRGLFRNRMNRYFEEWTEYADTNPTPSKLTTQGRYKTTHFALKNLYNIYKNNGHNKIAENIDFLIQHHKLIMDTDSKNHPACWNVIKSTPPKRTTNLDKSFNFQQVLYHMTGSNAAETQFKIRARNKNVLLEDIAVIMDGEKENTNKNSKGESLVSTPGSGSKRKLEFLPPQNQLLAVSSINHIVESAEEIENFFKRISPAKKMDSIQTSKN